MQRSGDSVKRMAPPSRPPSRQPISRMMSATPTLNGRASPAGSNLSKSRSPMNGAAVKRKERDYEQDFSVETNINVVVRCRGRNEREVKENSGVVVSADGIKGKTVNLSMGPSSVSDKTYQFDRVFSQAADQTMIFTEVVVPILDEVMSGFNCTIFAYGQTGTGKTYTMSGDITDVQPLPDESGIIPRVLHSLFRRMDREETEYSVKCSFIELYNEELRDLLAPDDSVKLKMFDDSNRKSHSATVVQGVEETFIKTASHGLDLLKVGSHKRQVAATKCNDLSSRSHTVFTITVHVKRPSEKGEDYVSVGKLNLVDLAGSENIQRSGAENKRAAEAGLINKSLLTLGRVINALVDKSAHIPYRESKLTRLLQDSLGGRTKTCIIATLSPTKSNLEETISTLDYAFRAKNIRNKPQMNQIISKMTLFREYSIEIEKLKGELIAARHRNGVYLTPETYDEITTESKSRKILSEELRDKIVNMEANLKNKSSELFNLTSDLNSLKSSHEATATALNDTKSILEKTDIILSHTQQSLREEEMLRKAHEKTESQLQQAGNELIMALDKSNDSMQGLHAKLRRRSDLHAINRSQWADHHTHINETAQSIDGRLAAFEQSHKGMLSKLSNRLSDFVRAGDEAVQKCVVEADCHLMGIDQSCIGLAQQATSSHHEMEVVIEEVQNMKGSVKEKVGQGLKNLSDSAEKIAGEVLTDLESMHALLHTSYSTLGRDLKASFDELLAQVAEQQRQADELRSQLGMAHEQLTATRVAASTKLHAVLTHEREQRVTERERLVSQVTALIQSVGAESDRRLEEQIEFVKADFDSELAQVASKHAGHSDLLNEISQSIIRTSTSISQSRESVESKLKADWNAADEQNKSIQSATRFVHAENVRVVDEQIEHMDVQLQTLDEVQERLKARNGEQFKHHVHSLDSLRDTVGTTRSLLHNSEGSVSELHSTLQKDVVAIAEDIRSVADTTRTEIQSAISLVREDIAAAPMIEYRATGETPQKATYDHPKALPRTEAHSSLLTHFRHHGQQKRLQCVTEDGQVLANLERLSPTKSLVYADSGEMTVSATHSSPEVVRASSGSRPTSSARNGGLRELDKNAGGNTIDLLSTRSRRDDAPPLKRQNTGGSNDAFSQDVTKLSERSISMVAEGRENLPLGASVGSGGRILRSRVQH